MTPVQLLKMRSVGPFVLTDEEYSGLRMRLSEDDQISKCVRSEQGVQMFAGMDLGTGESGETADVEAEFEQVERLANPFAVSGLQVSEKSYNGRP